MSSHALTIQIFLPHGDPRGIRVAEITTRIVQVIEVPRQLLDRFLEMPESRQVGVYFLFGNTEDEAGPSVYIGQTGDLRQRLRDHNKAKPFWERALVLISRTNSLTQTHGLFLEWRCIQETVTTGRFRSENGNAGSKPHTPAPLEAECAEIFETGGVLLATLGFPLFQPLGRMVSTKKGDEEFLLTARGCKGRGLYAVDGFVVLKGSEGRRDNVPSIEGTADARFRARLIESGVMVVKGETVIFPKDHLFKSPSAAATALMGRTANGWDQWHTKDGRTLDAVKRSGLTEPDEA